MTVSGFKTVEEAEARADFYRSRGYKVEVVTFSSALAGGHVCLRCTYLP